MTNPSLQSETYYLEILWKRPLNIYSEKANVLVLGGEKEIGSVLSLCQVFYNIKGVTVKVGYPDAHLKTLKQFLPDEMHCPLPSSPEKNLNFKEVAKIIQVAQEFDLVIIGLGLSKSEETKAVIKKLTATNEPIILLREGVIQEDLATYIKRAHNTILFVEPKILAAWSGINPTEVKKIEDVSFLRLKSLIKNISGKLKGAIIIYIAERNGQTIIIQNEKIIVFPLELDKNVLLALIAAFWAYNIKKPFASTSAAAYVTKVWQENFKNINEIEKAINRVEEMRLYE